MDKAELITLTADIVSAHVSKNQVGVGDIAGLVERTFEALSGLGQEQAEPDPVPPVVSARASVKPDKLICMACGFEGKMLKRHLESAHGWTPADYRERFGLTDSYPMVSRDYAQQRRDLAVEIGLGKTNHRRKRGTKARK